ncbi:MAG: VanZ family protein [Clostridia bacterium]|nr:VanZ family protein [Clostridia bacterium]
MKIKIFRIVSIILLVACMSVIFYLSSQTAEQSSEVSGGFTYKVFSLLYPHFNEMSPDSQQQVIDNAMFYVRKTAHMSIYFVLGIFSYMAFVSYNTVKYSLRLLISFAVCFLYSCSDEIHQIFVDGRSGEIRDVLIDSTGALAAIVIITLIVRLIPKLYNIVKGEKELE